MSSDTDIFAHRRGLMLGLTLAEVLMLVLFILLLTYTAILGKKAEELKEKDSTISDLELTSEELQLQLDLGISGLMNAINLPSLAISDENDLNARLREATQAMGSIKHENNQYSRLIASPDRADTLATALEEIGPSQNAEEILNAWIEENAVANDPLDNDEDSNPPPMETLEDALQVIERLENQLDFHDKRMLQAGNGLTFPPCWANNGKPVYIYDALLQDDGLTLKAIDDRTGQDRSGLKQNGAEPALNTLITLPNFISHTEGMFKWSVQARCRFYVRIRDGTSADNKLGYKQARRTVEQHFYIYDAK